VPLRGVTNNQGGPRSGPVFDPVGGIFASGKRFSPLESDFSPLESGFSPLESVFSPLEKGCFRQQAHLCLVKKVVSALNAYLAPPKNALFPSGNASGGVKNTPISPLGGVKNTPFPLWNCNFPLWEGRKTPLFRPPWSICRISKKPTKTP